VQFLEFVTESVSYVLVDAFKLAWFVPNSSHQLLLLPRGPLPHANFLGRPNQLSHVLNELGKLLEDILIEREVIVKNSEEVGGALLVLQMLGDELFEFSEHRVFRIYVSFRYVLEHLSIKGAPFLA